MDYTTLGRTGLKVSIAGLGCGGFSQLGLATGGDEAHAIGIVRTALDLGVNLFDTAASYATEEVLGKALRGVPRADVVICTKAPFAVSRPSASATDAVASLDRSLKKLGTDYIDVFQLHGVAPGTYDHALEVLAPALLREKEKGKLIWSFDIAKSGTRDITEVQVDAKTGKIVSTQTEAPADQIRETKTEKASKNQ